jgi:hypothetical protein
MPVTSPDRSIKKKGNVVDGTQFDTLVKRLSTTTLSRSTALRGLAASVAAFAGVTLTAEPGAAEERKICHCEDESRTSCETITVGKKAARRHLRDHDCDYRGKCTGVSGCCLKIGESCTTRLTCCSGNCLGSCQPCKTNGSSCGFNSECCSGKCNGTCQS